MPGGRQDGPYHLPHIHRQWHRGLLLRGLHGQLPEEPDALHRDPKATWEMRHYAAPLISPEAFRRYYARPLSGVLAVARRDQNILRQ